MLVTRESFCITSEKIGDRRDVSQFLSEWKLVNVPFVLSFLGFFTYRGSHSSRNQAIRTVWFRV